MARLSCMQLLVGALRRLPPGSAASQPPQHALRKAGGMTSALTFLSVVLSVQAAMSVAAAGGQASRGGSYSIVQQFRV